MSADSQMGELFFTLEKQKTREFVIGFILLFSSNFIIFHILTSYSELTFNALVVFSILALVSGWLGVSKFLDVFLRKIFFYAKGIMVVNPFNKYVILITEVKNVKIVRYGEDNLILIFKFEMKNGKKFVIDGRNYDDFALTMKEYGEKLNLDWSFPNV